MKKVLILLLLLAGCASAPQVDDGSITLTAEEKTALAHNIRQMLMTIHVQGAIIESQKKKIDELEKGSL